jgi:hypothetical protein
MIKLVACVAVALALIPMATWADCVDGTRTGSSAERTFSRQLGESLKAALPAAPAPLYLEYEPEVIMQTVCKDTPANEIGGLVQASYTASPNYSDRVKLTVRANFQFPGEDDLVLGTLPKKSSGLKVYNLVVQVEGYNKQYMESIKQALDRARLQAMIDQPLPDHPAPAAWQVGKAGATTGAPAATSTATQVADAAPAPAAGSPASTTAPQPKPAPAQPDVAQKTKDTVNKLRGLLGQ